MCKIRSGIGVKSVRAAKQKTIHLWIHGWTAPLHVWPKERCRFGLSSHSEQHHGTCRSDLRWPALVRSDRRWDRWAPSPLGRRAIFAGQGAQIADDVKKHRESTQQAGQSIRAIKIDFQTLKGRAFDQALPIEFGPSLQ